MTEKIVFHFEGALADKHSLNFYEASRFQYAAARLLVKLSQFRHAGKFSKKISNKTNFDIRLESQEDGSFNINVEDFGQDTSGEEFINIPLGDLVSYVSERVIEKIDEVSLGNTSSRTKGDADRAGGIAINIDELSEKIAKGEASLEDLRPKVRDLVRRRAAEVAREQALLKVESKITKIDFARSQKLIAMSAPLISEMAIGLRRSANTLEVFSSNYGDSKPILFLDQEMASAVETSVVDEDITSILCDVIQFNKDNGWGKVRIENNAIVSFSIPYDILPRIKQTLIDTMKKDQVYLQTYFVRDRAGEVIRLIVAGILPTPPV